MTLGEQLRVVMMILDLQPKQVAARMRRSRRTVYRIMDGTAGPRSIDALLIAFPDWHTLAHLHDPQNPHSKGNFNHAHQKNI